MHKTIIHIGMPRAASTFFQKEVFPKVQGFQFYGIDRSYYGNAFQKLMYQDESLYDQEAIRMEVSDIINGNSIISNELLVGQSLYFNASNRSRTAQRLKALFPKAEIVLILRNPVELLQSLYAIDVYGGNWRKPEDYIRFPDGSGRNTYPTFENVEHVETYRYAPLLALYQSLFEKVYVLQFDDFKTNPATFVSSLCSKMDWPQISVPIPEKKINQSLSGRQVRLIRALNRWKPLMESTNIGRGIFRKKLGVMEKIGAGGKKFEFGVELKEKIARYLDVQA